MKKSHSKLSKLVCRIRAGGGYVRVGGTCLKYLKRGWNRKEGRRKKHFKKRGKLGQEVCALKSWKRAGKGRAGTPLRTIYIYT